MVKFKRLEALIWPAFQLRTFYNLTIFVYLRVQLNRTTLAERLFF